MNKTVKSFVRPLVPPVLISLMRRFRTDRVSLKGDFSSWDEAASHCTGYDSEEILAKVLAATLKVKHGEAVFERDSVLFDKIEYSWPVLAGLMLAAGRSEGKLNVLDFGGALGTSYFQNRKFLNTLRDVVWNVVEQPNYVEAGWAHIQDGPIRFFKSINECLNNNQPNVVLLSSVLQYLDKPFEIIVEISQAQADVLLLDRTSFSLSGRDDVIKLQNVPESIYKATYPCRVFNEAKLCQFISGLGYQLLEGYAALDDFDPDTYWRGHIFLRRNDGL